MDRINERMKKMPPNFVYLKIKKPGFFIYQNDYYRFAPCQRQYFSLPFHLMNYLPNACNSPQIFEKLQKSCKYFFSKNKIIVFNAQIYSENETRYFCYEMTEREDDIKNYKLPETHQLWLTNALVIRRQSLSLFLEYTYRCDLKILEILNQDLMFKEISFLLNGGKITDLNLDHVNIKYEDGSPVTFDVILEKCPNVRHISYSNLCEIIASNTFEKLCQLKLTDRIHNFTLYISKMSDIIDPRICCKFLTSHVGKLIWIIFNCDISQNELVNFRSTIRGVIYDGIKLTVRQTRLVL